MQVDIITLDQLTTAHLAARERILRETSFLQSPFFRPKYTQHASRNDLEVSHAYSG